MIAKSSRILGRWVLAVFVLLAISICLLAAEEPDTQIARAFAEHEAIAVGRRRPRQAQPREEPVQLATAEPPKGRTRPRQSPAKLDIREAFTLATVEVESVEPSQARTRPRQSPLRLEAPQVSDVKAESPEGKTRPRQSPSKPDPREAFEISTQRVRPRVQPDRYQILPGQHLWTQAEVLQLAAGDILQQPAAERPHIRYLTTYNYPDDLRANWYRIASFSVNSVSRAGVIVRPTIVDPANLLLIRINLRDYKIPAAAWDTLADADPYFHQVALARPQVAVPVHVKEPIPAKRRKVGWYQTGKLYRDGTPEIIWGSFEAGDEQQAEQPAESHNLAVGTAGWLDPNVYATLISQTQSRAPILRADWCSLAITMSPYYYRLLSLKTEEDYRELVGSRYKGTDLIPLTVELEKDIKATVIRSGSDGLCKPVARNNRILVRWPTVSGYLWTTHDVKGSTGEKNFINILENEKWDETEQIGTLPNGLQVYFVTDGDGRRLPEGDKEVVTDSNFPDTRVINGRSCIVCHENGLQPFKSGYQSLVKDLTTLDVSDKRGMETATELARLIARRYSAPVNEFVEGDSQIYQKGVLTATGLESAQFAKLYGSSWLDYMETDLDINRVAYDTGLDPILIGALIPIKIDGRNNGPLLQLLAQPPLTIRRDQFEEAFKELMMRSMVKIRPKPDN